MRKESIAEILEQKRKDETEMGSEIAKIIGKYSDKWDDSKIEVEVTISQSIYSDMNPKPHHCYDIKTNIVL